MPTIETSQTIDVDVAVDIEVYCDVCGNGLCNSVTSTKGRNRGINQFRLPPCEDCIKKKDKEINDLKQEIEDLKQQIN